MATWFVRPDTSHNSIRNGTSYENAWGGWASIVWGAAGVNAGDTLYVCGRHESATSLAVGNHTASTKATAVIIRGDYSGDPGSIVFTANAFVNARRFTEYRKLTVVGNANSCFYLYDPSGVTIDSCDLSAGYAGVSFGGDISFSDFTITKNKIHDLAGVVNVNGRGIAGLISTTSRTLTNIVISGNEIYNCPDASIRLSIESAAWDTTKFIGVTVEDNDIHDCGGTFQFRSGPADTVTTPTLFSKNLVVRGNKVRRCGTIAGPSGMHGSLSVSGWDGALIERNVLHDNYVTGAGIQTAKNKNIRIRFNDIRRIKSGTPSSQFQNGFPIDGNGIFFDNKTINGIAYGNYIEGLVSTGITNSGTGLAFWDGTDATYVGNIVVDCYRGASYGAGTESGNKILNNTFINCGIGVLKVGAESLAGSIEVKNNLLVNCAVGFSIGENPSIYADYNQIHGSTTNYIGITAGAHDLYTDPRIAATGIPTANSPCIGAGTPMPPTLLDYHGFRFAGRPTIGAVEMRRFAYLRR